ncbi:MAG: T9SS type A sorting domain-containing protein [Flavobacteriia bacterium]|nr:T9SS type A sorting domain-containing protein [Flavobacteriia bacterium]
MPYDSRIQSVKVFNMSGALLIEHSSVGETHPSIYRDAIGSGAYIMEIVDEFGQSLREKLIVH